jgi:uncharacterized protein (DUF2141 family)
MRASLAKLLLPLIAVALGACGKDAVRSSSSPSSGASVVIAVTVRGAASTEGRIRMALFASEDGFPGEPEQALRQIQRWIAADTVHAVFENVPEGRYAISVLHDADDDGEMKQDFMGRPKEGYGFSRDARGRFGPPGFDSAAFDAAGDTTHVLIELEY